MDYVALAPIVGNHPYYRNSRILYNITRTNTNLISSPHDTRSVNAFINYLHDIVMPDPEPTPPPLPIGDIYLCSHANSHGNLQFPILNDPGNMHTYEQLMECLNVGDNTIAVLDSLIGYIVGNPITNNLHIKGCNIGKVTPILNLFKEALGGNMKVTAPLHFHALAEYPSSGVFEFMCYEFKISRKRAFAVTDKAGCVNEFFAKGFTFYDGDPVTREDWNRWIPRNLKRAMPGSPWNLGVDVNDITTIHYNPQFRHNPPVHFTYTSIPYPDRSSVPTSEVDRMAVLNTILDRPEAGFGDTFGHRLYPFPTYKRYGFASKNDFVQGVEWRFTVDSNNILTANGTLHYYTILMPITGRSEANMGNLLFNFYPNDSFDMTLPIPEHQLLVTDPIFFATV